MRVLTATLAAAVVLGLAGAASAQSLGQLADKEKQKRQGKPAPKPITENDLARAGKKGTLSMTAGPDAPVDATGQAADAATADAATTAEGTTEGVAEGATEGAPEAAAPAPAPEPVKPKGPPPKSEDELRAEAKADVQKKLDAARTNLANHQLVLAQIEQVLNASATYGEVSQGRADLMKRQVDEKAAVSKFTDEIAQLEETLRRSARPR